MTLETYLRSAAMQGQRDHVLRATMDHERVTCWIATAASAAQALHFEVIGNALRPDPQAEFAAFDRAQTLIDGASE